MKTKETIKMLLEKYPSLKDSDNRLVVNYWNLELQHKGFDVSKMSASDLMKMYADSKLTNTESIRRSRQKLQQEHPELRGKIYNLRQGKEQDKWKENLGYHVDKINKI